MKVNTFQQTLKFNMSYYEQQLYAIKLEKPRKIMKNHLESYNFSKLSEMEVENSNRPHKEENDNSN